MTFDYYENQFRKKALKSGFSEDEIQKCLKYAEPIIKKGLPVIYNTSNLSAFVGYRKNYLKRAALFTPYFYRKFYIKKRGAEKDKKNLREIKEPLPSLKEIQIWILNNILYSIHPNKFAKAYIPNRNVLDNVRYHRNKSKVVSLDIKDFFPSIKRSYVEKIFLNMGYSSNVSNLLSKLCCCEDILPQGAPTSPYLSNIYLFDFDNKIGKYCVALNIRYTRYADDMIFSGDFEEQSLIDFVAGELSKINLSMNLDKIKVMTPNTRQIATGIVLNKTIQIPKSQRLFIRQEIYYIKKFGLSEHLLKTQNNRANYLNHLLGKINYALSINPQDIKMKEYRGYISDFLFS